MNTYVGVFGYGSLVAKNELKRYSRGRGRPKPHAATLNGFQRQWNTSTTHGQIFLGIVPDPKAYVNGVVIYVDEQELLGLDLREMLYHRQRIDSWIKGVQGPIYTYVTDYFYQRNADSQIKRGVGFIDKLYLDLVEEAFSDVGSGYLQTFRITTFRDRRIQILDNY